MKNSKEYRQASINAYCNNETMFEAGYDFAMSQPKYIFDGVAQVGEVRRFEGGLVDVTENDQTCSGCCLLHEYYLQNCQYLTGCDINNVKYVKR